MERSVVVVAFDRCQSLDVVGPLEVFAGAREARAAAEARDLAYTTTVAAPAARVVTTSSALRIVPDAALSGLARARIDTLIVAGGAGARRASEDARVVGAIEKLAGRARRVASVCTGAFVLGAAGLLDGRRATTHWAWCDALAKRFPHVHVERDPIYVRDRHVWTSAGVTAGIDLALAMVEDDLGRELASLVAKHLVVFVRRAGGQSQFSAQLEAQAAERVPLRELQSWIVEHPHARLDVPTLAKRAAMSVRNFARVFRAETGLSPAAYVESVRVETARRLLETTAQDVEAVAERAGFGDAAALRRALARRVGLSPREYRARFGAPQEETHAHRVSRVRRPDRARRGRPV